MGKVRYYIFLAAGLLVHGVLVGIQPTLWVFLVVMLAVGSNIMAGVALDRIPIIRGRDQERGYIINPWPGRLIGLFSFGSLAISITAAIVLGRFYGWGTGLAVIVLSFSYFPLRWTEHDEFKQQITKLRKTLHALITQTSAGKLTKKQLDLQANIALANGLHNYSYVSPSLIELLLQQDALPDIQYNMYLLLLDQYLDRAEQGYRITPLHKEVQARLESSGMR